MISGQELVGKLMEQIQPFGPQFHFGEMVVELERTDGGFLVRTDAGTTIACKVVVVAAGGGSFQPKRPPIPGIQDYEGTSVFYSVRRMEDFRDHDLLVVGGGDSALDWTLNLQPLARSLTLVHRRPEFRAAARQRQQDVRACRRRRSLEFQIGQVTGLKGADGQLEAAIVKGPDGDVTCPVHPHAAVLRPDHEARAGGRPGA